MIHKEIKINKTDVSNSLNTRRAIMLMLITASVCMLSAGVGAAVSMADVELEQAIEGFTPSYENVLQSSSFPPSTGYSQELLKENYSLTLLEVNPDGNEAWISLSKNGVEVDDEVVAVGESYYYNSSLSFKLDKVFAGTSGNYIEIRNIYQYSEEDSSVLVLNESALLLTGLTGKFILTGGGLEWQLEENYTLHTIDIDIAGHSREAMLLITKDGTHVDYTIINVSDSYTYYKNGNLTITVDLETVFSGEGGVSLARLYHVYQYSEDTGEILLNDSIHLYSVGNTRELEWQLDQNYSLSAMDIDSKNTPRQVWLRLKKDGNTLEDKFVYSGDNAIFYNGGTKTLDLNVGTIFDGQDADLVFISDIYQYSETNENDILIENETHLFIFGSSTGNDWQLYENYTLSFMDIDIKKSPNQVWLRMKKNGTTVDDNVVFQNEDYKYYNNSTLLFEGYLKSSFGGRYLDMLTFTNTSQYSEFYSTQLIADATYSFYPENVEIVMELNDKEPLDENYIIVPVDVQIFSESLWLRLYKDNAMVDEVILLEGQNYSYYSDSREIISTNLAAIFLGMNTNRIKFEDFYQYSEVNGSILKYYDDLWLKLGRLIPPSAPVASDQSVATPENTIVDITLSATDVDGDSLTYSIVDDPSHGNVTLSGNIATYTPDTDYNGSDNFTFKANDSTVDSNTATVLITVSAVNNAPVASDQSVTTPGNTIVYITLSATDVDGDSLTYSIVDDPSHGNVTLSGNIATYTPDADYNGSDNFTFKANDSTVDSNTATVSITVSAVNNAPVADFTGTPISGSEPLTVVFADTSTSYDGITACAWDFNNNGTVDSTEQNPTHVYTQSGTYTVTLTVYEAEGDSHTETKTDYITVTTPPDTIVASIYVNETGWWRNSSEFNASIIPIQHAINNATATDVIYVYNGSYTENVNLDEQLTLIGEGTDVVTVTAAVSNDHVFKVKADYVNISGFTVTGATDSHITGIYLDKVSHCHIFNNNASNNDYGIYLHKSENNTLTDNIANSNNGCGIYLEKSEDNTLTDNTANSNNDSGIYLDGSNNNTLTNNIANSNNDCGIYLHKSKDNTLTDNNVTSNNHSGIYLDGSKDNTLTDNTANSNNGCGINLDKSNDNTLTDNTANSNNGCGINLDKSNDNTLIDNTVTSNNHSGIYVDGLNNNALIDNTVTSNNHSGIYLDGSNNNTLTDNNVTSNNDCGIYLDGSNDNTLTDNTVTLNNHSGIYLDGSNDNTLTDNTVTLNNHSGIYLYGSKDNLIYNNYFDNTNNACEDNNVNDKKGKNNNNIWNVTVTNEAGQNIIGGSYLGGNYWSDYAGVDSNGDGLGDTLTPYNSSGNITKGGDYLPLVTEASVTIDTPPSDNDRNHVNIRKGSSGEASKNIAVKEEVRKYIAKGTTVTFQFKEDANSIEFIKFDGKTNAGYVIATVETLKDESTLVSSTPSGQVYQYMNIFIGDDYATDKNIANAVIRIKVAKPWIAENDIDGSTIMLHRYSKGKWNQLVTKWLHEDAKYLYLEAETPGFSPFAITGKTIGETGGEGIIEPTVTAEETPAPTPTEKKGIPGFSLFAGLSVLMMAVQLLRKKN